jgi:hypothetical protein
MHERQYHCKPEDGHGRQRDHAVTRESTKIRSSPRKRGPRAIWIPSISAFTQCGFVRSNFCLATARSLLPLDAPAAGAHPLNIGRGTQLNRNDLAPFQVSAMPPAQHHDASWQAHQDVILATRIPTPRGGRGLDSGAGMR